MACTPASPTRRDSIHLHVHVHTVPLFFRLLLHRARANAPLLNFLRHAERQHSILFLGFPPEPRAAHPPVNVHVRRCDIINFDELAIVA